MSPRTRHPSQGPGRHPMGCTCVRCTGWPKGNGLSMKHGAKSSVERLLPEALPIADELRPLVPAYAPSDEPLLRLLAVTLRRVERAEAWTREAEEAEDVERREIRGREVRAWIASAARLLDALGMTPRSRASLGLDLVRTTSALDEYVAREYGEDAPVEHSLAPDLVREHHDLDAQAPMPEIESVAVELPRDQQPEPADATRAGSGADSHENELPAEPEAGSA